AVGGDVALAAVHAQQAGEQGPFVAVVIHDERPALAQGTSLKNLGAEDVNVIRRIDADAGGLALNARQGDGDVQRRDDDLLAWSARQDKHGGTPSPCWKVRSGSEIMAIP